MKYSKPRELQTDEEGVKPFYHFEAEALGPFQIRSGFPEEKAKELVVVNGPSILYGFIKELVVSITARGPHPCVVLPLVTFADAAVDLNGKNVRTPTVKTKRQVVRKRREPERA